MNSCSVIISRWPFPQLPASCGLIAYDDAVGLPLDQALAALEWTAQVGILAAEDLVHAARLSPDSAAIVVERRDGDNHVFVYFGPRMDAPPADPYEGTLLYDEPGVRSYIFAQRGHAMAHFLRATHGLGAAFGHGTGHGLGIEVHEEPRISRRRPDDSASAAVQAGMVFTIEPGAYVPGLGGVRIEDDVLVTEEGVEVLTDVSTDLIEI